MPRLALLSDLHLESSNFTLNTDGADVLVVAGDLQAGPHAEEGICWLAEKSPIPVVYVPGNHEFEQTAIVPAIERLRRAAEGTKVHFLHNDSIDLFGVRFVGTPLYSGFRLNGEAHQAAAMARANVGIWDFESTRLDGTERWNPARMVEWHDEACAWLSGELEECEFMEIPSVVVTHWAPSRGSIAPQFQGDSLSPYFANACEGLVERSFLWLHGHLHTSFDYHVGQYANRGQVVCNPRGVSKLMDLSSNPGFERVKLIELPQWSPRLWEAPPHPFDDVDPNRRFRQ